MSSRHACRRVFFEVISRNRPGEVLASINFGWEGEAFYLKRMPYSTRGVTMTQGRRFCISAPRVGSRSINQTSKRFMPRPGHHESNEGNEGDGIVTKASLPLDVVDFVPFVSFCETTFCASVVRRADTVIRLPQGITLDSKRAAICPAG